MSKKTQSILIIAATLCAGILIGALGSGTLRHQRRDRLDRMRPEERFQHAMERIIQPTPAQRESVASLLARRHDQIALLRERYEDELVAIYDSLDAELVTLLSPEQRNRLEAHFARAPRAIIEHRFARIAEELDLSQSQHARVKKILERNFGEVEKVGFSSRARRHERQIMRGRLRKCQKEIEEVLTSEQLEKFRRLRHHSRRMFHRPAGPDSFDMPPPPPPEEERP